MAKAGSPLFAVSLGPQPPLTTPVLRFHSTFPSIIRTSLYHGGYVPGDVLENCRSGSAPIAFLVCKRRPRVAA